MEIREFERGDACQVLELAKLIFPDFDEQDYLKMMVNKNYLFLVATINSEIVGFVNFLTIDLKLEIIKIGVKPNFRKLGVATKLIEEMGKYCLKLQKSGILLEVNEKNEPARNLYSKLGFKEIHVRKKYYNYVDDAIIMVKNL